MDKNLKDKLDDVDEEVENKVDDLKDEAEDKFENLKDKAEDLKDDVKEEADEFKDKAKEVAKDVAKVARDVYDKTADTAKKVMADERVQEFAHKTGDALDKGAKAVVVGSKKGAKVVMEKTEEVLSDPRVEKTIQTAKEKSAEIGGKVLSGIKGLFAKKDVVEKEVKDVVDDVVEEAVDVVDEVKEDLE